MSKAALCATSTVRSSPTKARNCGNTTSMPALSRTMSSVMPWKRIDALGIGRPGLTSWSKFSPASSRRLTTRTPAIWMISSPLEGARPVVSVSNTT